MHGQFIWYELTTPDVDAAQKFYPRFTEWGTQPFDDDYTMWTTGGVPFAGIFRLRDEMRQQGIPPNWMPYIESTSVDETAKKVTSLGGKVIVPPADIPGTGRFAVVQDPQGATFGVYKSANQLKAWDGTPVVGRFSWHELMTTDHAKAFEFYRALFGWEKAGEMDMGGGNMYAMYGTGDRQYGGMFDITPEMAGMHPFWLCYIHVQDVGRAVTTATKAGAVVQRPQMDIPGGSIAILGDPQGAGFALHHATPQVTAAKPAAKVAKAAKSVAKSVAQAATTIAKTVAEAAKTGARQVATAVKAKATRLARATAATKAKGRPKSAKTAAKKGAKSAARKSAKTVAKSVAKKVVKKAATKAKAKPKTGMKVAGRKGAAVASRGAGKSKARKR